MRRLLLTIALLISTGPLLADVLRAEDAGVVVDALLPTERQQNANSLQYAIDTAEDAPHKTLVMPDGDVYVDMTPQRRYIAIDKSLNLRSAGRTRIHLGPNTFGGTGFNHINFEWHLIHVRPKSLTLNIDPGIELVAPQVDSSRYWESQVGALPYALPAAFFVEGAGTAGTVRTITWDKPRIEGPFNEGIVIGGDNPLHLVPPPAGIRTEVYLTDARISTAGNGISAFGTDKLLKIDGLWMKNGGVYANGTGYGNGIYCHDGATLQLSGFNIYSTGRDCIKKAGTNSTGGAAGSYITMGTVNSTRKGWGTGVSLDTFSDNAISNVTFGSNLNIGVGVRGKAQTSNCVFHCPIAFGGSGDLQGGSPVILSTADRFVNVSQIWALGVQNAFVRFVDSTVVPAPGAVLFSLPDNPISTTMIMEVIRAVVTGDVRSCIDAQGGKWLIDSLTHNGTASHGVYGFGMRSGSAVVKGGTWDRLNAFHSSTSPEAKARVVVRD